MRYSSFSLSLLSIVLWLSVAAAPAGAAPPSGARPNVRPLDELAGSILDEAVARSRVVQELLARLDASRVIVHVQSAHDLPMGIGGTTRFVTSRGGYRFIRVSLSSGLRGIDRIAILAHELHHAFEIADSLANTLSEVEHLLESTGYRTRARFYETGAAVRMERVVRDELRRGPALAEIRARSIDPDK